MARPKTRFRNTSMALLCLEHKYMKYHNPRKQFEELIYFRVSEEKVITSVHLQPADKIRYNSQNDPRFSGFIGNREITFNSFQTHYLKKDRFLNTLTFISQEEFEEAFKKFKK